MRTMTSLDSEAAVEGVGEDLGQDHQDRLLDRPLDLLPSGEVAEEEAGHLLEEEVVADHLDPLLGQRPPGPWVAEDRQLVP